MSPNLDLEYVHSVLEDDSDPFKYYGEFIKMALPELNELTDRDVLLAYLSNDEDLQEAVLDYVLDRLEGEVPQIIDVYREQILDYDYRQPLTGEDIKKSIFMYVNARYKTTGIFSPEIDSIFEDGELLVYGDAKEKIRENMGFFLGYNYRTKI
jgi:hypothetical protein